MKRILSVIFSVIIFAGCLSSAPVYAKTYTAVIEKDGVMQMGDFDSLSDGFIVYFPKEVKSTDRKYPVAVWANGTMCPPALYYSVLTGIAKNGYIVIASPDMMSKSGKGQIAAIDYIAEQNEDKNSVFYNKVDLHRIGAIGQSQGGASCVNAAAADDRIGAIVSIAGASTKEEASLLNVPALFLTGSLDFIVLSSEWVKPSFDACPSPAVYASLNNGTHTSFLLNADTYVNYSVKWFNAWLYDDGDKSAFMNGGELSKDRMWSDFKAKNFDSGSSEDDISFLERLLSDTSRFIRCILSFILR